MDPFTHTLLGASLGYVAFNRRLGRHAAGVGGLAAFVPDADVFIRSATDPLLAIEYHRHFTHSLAFAPVGAAIVASLWLLRPAFRPHAAILGGCALLGYVSHCLLDAATTYGTQLLQPFSNQRFGWDVISIIDPLFTLALAVGLGWSLFRLRTRPAACALVFSAAYLVAGVVQHTRAVAAQHSLAASRGHTIERSEVMPGMANNLIWRALYLHEGRIYSDRLRVGWFSRPTVRPGWSVPLVTDQQLTAAERVRDTRRFFARFAWFSEHWVGRSPADPSLLADMRYTLSAEAFDPIWGIRFNPPEASLPVAWVNRSRDRQVAPGELWREIIGRDPRFQPLPP